MQATAKIILCFFIYAVMGWCWETIFCSARMGYFVYRGFLYGPYCPIYGFGVILVLYFIMPLKRTTFEIFILAIISVTALEYATGYMLEILFKTTFWNYEALPLNIQGRVAVPVSVFWGLCCIMIVKYIQPYVTSAVNWLHMHFGIWLAALILVMLLMDTVISTNRMLVLRENMEDNTSAAVRHSRDVLESRSTQFLREREKIPEKFWLDAEKTFFDICFYK